MLLGPNENFFNSYFLGIGKNLCNYLSTGTIKYTLLLTIWIIACIIALISSINVQMMGPVTTQIDYLRASRNLSHYLQPNRNSTIISARPSIPCFTQLKPITIVYFIASSPSNFKRRRAVRETWGKELIPKPIFFTGTTNDSYDMVII